MEEETNKRYSIQTLTPQRSVPNIHPIIKLVDPSGITSYGDVYDAYTTGNATDKVVNTVQAIPAYGKVGKVVNILSNIGGLKQDFDIYNKRRKQNMKSDMHNKEALYQSLIGANKILLHKGPSRNSRYATPAQIEWYIDNSNGVNEILYPGDIKSLPEPRITLNIAKPKE